MVFVDRLAVHDRFNRRAVVVHPGLVVAAGELGDVAVLPHIEIEPLIVVKYGRGALASGRMDRNQMRTVVARAQASRHGAKNLLVQLGFDRPVAAENPDDVRRLFVASAKPLPVSLSISGGEHLGARASLDVPLVTPGWQKSDVDAASSRLFHDEVDVIPVVVVRSVLDIRCGRIVVE